MTLGKVYHCNPSRGVEVHHQSGNPVYSGRLVQLLQWEEGEEGPGRGQTSPRVPEGKNVAGIKGALRCC